MGAVVLVLVVLAGLILIPVMTMLLHRSIKQTQQEPKAIGYKTLLVLLMLCLGFSAMIVVLSSLL